MDGVGFCVGLWAASIDIRRASVVSIFASDAFIFGACDVVVDDFFFGCEKLSSFRLKEMSLYFPLIVAGYGRGLSCVGGGAMVRCWQGSNSWWWTHRESRERSVCITQMYIFSIVCFNFISAMFTLTGDFYPCVIFSWIPTLSFRFLRVVA